MRIIKFHKTKEDLEFERILINPLLELVKRMGLGDEIKVVYESARRYEHWFTGAEPKQFYEVGLITLMPPPLFKMTFAQMYNYNSLPPFLELQWREFIKIFLEVKEENIKKINSPDWEYNPNIFDFKKISHEKNIT